MANFKVPKSSNNLHNTTTPKLVPDEEDEINSSDDNFEVSMGWLTPAKIKVPKSSEFHCKFCDYTTSRHSQYIRHLATDKHKVSAGWLTETNDKCQDDNAFQCICCGKQYKHASSLSKHKKKCNKFCDDKLPNKMEKNDLLNLNGTELIMTLINENKDFKNIIIEQSKTLVEQNKTIQDLVQKVGNNNNNVNSNNKTFNLQVFLNETCKNAMSINDFIESIQPTLQDLENVGRVGYAEGISNIIINKLNTMEITRRPIHCTDTKREVTYIKSDDEWNKELDDKPLLLRAIKEVANKNIQNIMEWQKANPGCNQADSRKNDMFLNIVSNSMCGSDKEETNKNFGKIISKISKEVSLSEYK